MFEECKKGWGQNLNFLGLKRRKRRGKYSVLWNEDAVFRSLYDEIKERTLVTVDRCFMLYQLSQVCRSLPGDFAEVGVYKGGTAHMIARACPQKTFHLFDTFGGMPKVNVDVDVHKKGEFADTSLESVKQFLNKCETVEFHQGTFPGTAQSVQQQTFSFVHCDVDIYSSVKDTLEFFYSKMVPGGIMVFDDYMWKDCPGVKKALDEFLTDKPEEMFITTLYQCALIKQV